MHEALTLLSLHDEHSPPSSVRRLKLCSLVHRLEPRYILPTHKHTYRCACMHKWDRASPPSPHHWGQQNLYVWFYIVSVLDVYVLIHAVFIWCVSQALYLMHKNLTRQSQTACFLQALVRVVLFTLAPWWVWLFVYSGLLLFIIIFINATALFLILNVKIGIFNNALG